jgi:hypothetical protein
MVRAGNLDLAVWVWQSGSGNLDLAIWVWQFGFEEKRP